MQNPSSHLQGSGCPRCGGSGKKTQAQFIEDAVALHGARYTYESVHYVDCEASTLVTCRQHGTFTITPSNHLSGKGCPKCAGKAQNVVYLWKLSTFPNTYKLGITTNTLGVSRIAQVAKAHKTDYHILRYKQVGSAKAVERRLGETLNKYKSTNITVGLGYTEMYDLPEDALLNLLGMIDDA